MRIRFDMPFGSSQAMMLHSVPSGLRRSNWIERSLSREGMASSVSEESANSTEMC